MPSRRDVLIRIASSACVPPALSLLTACRTSRHEVEQTTNTITPTPTPETIAPSPVPEPPVSASAILPSPDCSSDRVMRCVAGVRPYRNNGVRLESERLHDKLIIHNYGHGGAGITLAPGSSMEVTELLRNAQPTSNEVAVIGAGIMGLMSAHTLIESGYRVWLYYDRMLEQTTSWVAGGQWAPAGVRFSGDRFRRVCVRSLEWYSSHAGEEFGIFHRPNYVTGPGGGGFGALPAGILPPPERLERLPFEGSPKRGRVYQTLLVEPPRFLQRLSQDVLARCDHHERARFDSLDELMALPHHTIVNCAGMGARNLFKDESLLPIRGQLVMLEPQDLPWLLSHRGYIFPRSDAVVLGGTYERGNDSTTPDPSRCERIRRTNERVFEGG
ncbi:MAG: FAD-dependent oxidoreductase [Phycisphaerales bacterium JB043]